MSIKYYGHHSFQIKKRKRKTQVLLFVTYNDLKLVIQIEN